MSESEPTTAAPPAQDSPAALGSNLPPDQAAALAAMAHLGQGSLADSMGIEVVHLGADRTVARMPVAGNTQPLGLLHGGASAVLAETVGSFAAALYAGPGRVALGIEISCSHHRSATSGHVTATATPLARGRSLATYAIGIVDDAGRAVCTARLTCLLRDA